MSAINVTKLDQDLRAAGVPIDGVSVSPDGSARVDFAANATAQDRANAQGVVATHDPGLTPAQILEGRPLPRLALAALVVRASSCFSSLTAQQKAKVQAVIDNAAAAVMDLLT